MQSVKWRDIQVYIVLLCFGKRYVFHSMLITVRVVPQEEGKGKELGYETNKQLQT